MLIQNKQKSPLNSKRLTGQTKKLNLKMAGIITFALFLAAGILGFGESAKAAEYYMNSDGSEDCSNLQACFTLMSGGDTLIIRNGIYTGSSNLISDSNYPPDGPSTGSGDERFTIIKAENNGQVVIDGGTMGDAIRWGQTAHEWLKFEGIVFKHSQDAQFLVSTGYWGTTSASSNHLYFSKCGFHRSGSGGKSVVWLANNYNLFEDCHFWGSGKYLIHIRADYNIFRRCVGRPDDMNGKGQPIGAFMSYEGVYIEWQNCIVVDADMDYWSNYSYMLGGFVSHRAADRNGTDYNFWRGCISLNNNFQYKPEPYSGSGRSFAVAGSTSENNQIINSIVWGCKGKGISGSSANNTVDSCTVGDMTNPVSTSIPKAADCYVGFTSIIDSIGYNATRSGFNGVSLADYTNAFGSGTDYNSTTHTNDISGNPLSQGLEYLPRIEDSSFLKTAGSGGGQVGATVIKKYGIDGTFYGDTGYNILTDEPLWPFPYEEQIKSDFASYNPTGGPSGTRGFCASSNGLYGGPITLTSYIWEYLGNPCPSDICAYGADLTPPSRSNPQPAGTLSSGTTLTTISLTTNETAKCKYSTNSGTNYDLMENTFTNTNSTSHSTTVSGLSDGNSYTYYIRCQDTATPPNQNPNDFNLSFSIASASTTYGILDFAQLVIEWLWTSLFTVDLNDDGIVNTRDLGIMMSNWE